MPRASPALLEFLDHKISSQNFKSIVEKPDWHT